MAYAEILYRVEDKVAIVTLNRPDRLNAWTPVMHTEVKAAMRAAGDDAQVCVIVLTGAGRGFCAGADMSALQGIQSGERREWAPEEPFDRQAHPSFQRTYS
jgi:enoyl-CoA hydratase/carnithine racemase